MWGAQMAANFIRASQLAPTLARAPLATCRRAGATAAGLPEVYFGTMTFGWNQASSAVDLNVASAMLQRFLAAGGKEVDTARIYSAGDTEPMLGQILRSPEVQGREYRLGTKAHPSQPGGLSAKGIRSQLEASLEALQTDRVDVLYLHQPDPENSLTESLECIHALIREGKVGQLGLSNYSAVETERLCNLCQANGWTMPSFYQGLYNPLNRLVEEDLLPILRRHAVGFVAFNPLAAGLLTGKHRPGGEVLAGRFKSNPNYLPRFYTDANFEALTRIRGACEAHGLGMVAATYSWLLRHSKLDAALGDGLLLGASSVQQLEENLTACGSAQELPSPVLDAFDGAWELCKDGPFPYWRSYSSDQPGRESLHPGASYEACKGLRVRFQSSRGRAPLCTVLRRDGVVAPVGGSSGIGS